MTTEIVFCGDAWGEVEARFQHPFVGSAGQELARMLNQAGYPCEPLPYRFTSTVRMLQYWDKFPHQMLNVFNAHPAENDIRSFYAKPGPGVQVSREFPARRFNNSNYFLKPEFVSHVHRLHETLRELKPNVIVALGNTALWALGLPPSIGKLRGTIVPTPFGKVIPTHHPASVIKNWSFRTIALLDLHKALRESARPDCETMGREIWTEPTIQDLYDWWDKYGSKSKLLAFDIETLLNQQVSEVGFAADAAHALHVPFVWREGRTYKSWWPDAKTELAAWEFVKMVCESDVPKIGQNVVQYDTYWMLHVMGIQVRNVAHDTMQLAHCWQPELEKGLGFLGSLFLNEYEWKSIRKDAGRKED